MILLASASVFILFFIYYSDGVIIYSMVVRSIVYSNWLILFCPNGAFMSSTSTVHSVWCLPHILDIANIASHDIYYYTISLDLQLKFPLIEYEWLSLLEMTWEVFMWVQVRHLGCQHGWQRLGFSWKSVFNFTNMPFKFGLLLYVIFICSGMITHFLVISRSPSNFFRICRRLGFLGL